MKKISFLFFLLAGHTILTSNGGKAKPPWEEENVSFPMMNQEIRHSMNEHERQVVMKNNGQNLKIQQRKSKTD